MGYLLDGKSIGRIRKAVQQVETSPRNPRARRARNDRATWQTTLQLFELTASLSPGGSATAKLMKWDGAEWVEDESWGEITVHDSVGDKNGVSGDRGWCFRSHRSKRFEVVQLQC